MKLKYKHQRFQADAAKSVTDIFTGQQYCDSADFLIDLGKNKGALNPLQITFVTNYNHKEKTNDPKGKF